MNTLLYSAIISGLLVISLLIGCNNPSFLPSNNPQEIIESQKKEVLLEIHTKYTGMMRPNGTLLDIKLYSIGEAEFEYFVPSQKEIYIANETKSRKVLLEKEVVQQIKTLIESPDFIKAKEFYPPSIPLSDASTTTTINIKNQGQERKIVLKETDTSLHLEKKDKEYPKSVMILLRLIYDLRSKYDNKSVS